MAPRASTAFLVFAALALSGCSGASPEPVKTKYVDADRRLGQSVDGGFSDLREVNIPHEVETLTVRASFRADDGLSFNLRDPDGVLSTQIGFPYAAEVREMHWVEAYPPDEGRWRFGLVCDRRCEYAFGFYFDNAVEDLDGLAKRYSDAGKRFVHDSEGATEQSNEFNVPRGTERISVAWSVAAEGRFSFTLRDAMGNKRTAMAFPHAVSVDDIRYVIVEDPRPGTWRFELSCEDACEYAFGFYLEE